MPPIDREPENLRQELSASQEALNVAKRHVVASAVAFGLDHAIHPKKIDTMTAAELELVRRIACQRPEWAEPTRVNLADPLAAELLDILRWAQKRLHQIALLSLRCDLPSD